MDVGSCEKLKYFQYMKRASAEGGYAQINRRYFNPGFKRAT